MRQQWATEVQIFSAPTSGARTARSIVLWGGGTVGHAVERALIGRGCSPQLNLPTLWHQFDSLRQSIERAGDADVLQQPDEIHHIYAAGSAGFGADSTQTTQELKIFEQVLEGLVSQAQKWPGATRSPDLQFHLISSAGGLFERTATFTG